MNKKDVDDVLMRLMALLDVKNDSELARALRVNRQTLASWRKRDSVPYSICITLSEEKGFSLDWLLTGRGSPVMNDVSHEAIVISEEERNLLNAMNQLDPEVRKDLLRSAEEKQRLIELEKKVRELSSELQNTKRAG
ncbi:helix-turn-helix domain-containing protein [Klebsiella pneumoniae]|uniref:helix-turn-helix domain-containing protein n=1 Tax=Klebsiella pneumoniae TaxID=573 RepID=UPI003CF47255